MVRRLTANISEDLEDVNISEFMGEGPAGLKAEWDTTSGLEQVIEAVNEDEIFPDYDIDEVMDGSAEQVGIYENDGFTDYTFNSSEYHLRVREHDIGWKKTEVEFIGLGNDEYQQEISFYNERL